jgi:hypothetical protein
MKNARSLPDLVDFVGAFDHPLSADETGDIQKTALGKGISEPQIKVRRKDVHFQARALKAANAEIVERCVEMALAVDGENVL